MIVKLSTLHTWLAKSIMVVGLLIKTIENSLIYCWRIILILIFLIRNFYSQSNICSLKQMLKITILLISKLSNNILRKIHVKFFLCTKTRQWSAKFIRPISLCQIFLASYQDSPLKICRGSLLVSNSQSRTSA